MNTLSWQLPLYPEWHKNGHKRREKSILRILLKNEWCYFQMTGKTYRDTYRDTILRKRKEKYSLYDEYDEDDGYEYEYEYEYDEYEYDEYDDEYDDEEYEEYNEDYDNEIISWEEYEIENEKFEKIVKSSSSSSSDTDDDIYMSSKYNQFIYI